MGPMISPAPANPRQIHLVHGAVPYQLAFFDPRKSEFGMFKKDDSEFLIRRTGMSMDLDFARIRSEDILAARKKAPSPELVSMCIMEAHNLFYTLEVEKILPPGEVLSDMQPKNGHALDTVKRVARALATMHSVSDGMAAYHGDLGKGRNIYVHSRNPGISMIRFDKASAAHRDESPCFFSIVREHQPKDFLALARSFFSMTDAGERKTMLTVFSSAYMMRLEGDNAYAKESVRAAIESDKAAAAEFSGIKF